MDRMGPLLCLLSAAGFGAMAIFGKLAYDAGVEVGDLLLVRFAVAAALLLAVAAATGALRGLPRRSVLAGLGMGAIGYATQSGLYFAALERMDASLLALVLYVYPALVLLGAVALGRERASVGRVPALHRARGHRAVLVGAASGDLDALGTAMGFGAALAYTVLHPHRRPRRRAVAAGCAGGVRVPGRDVHVRAGVRRARRTRARIRRRRLGMGGRDRPREHGRSDPLLLRRPGAGGAVGGVDPFDPGAAGHRRAGGGGVRRVARRGAAGWGRTGTRGRAGDAVAGAAACDVRPRHGRGPGQRQLRRLRREGGPSDVGGVISALTGTGRLSTTRWVRCRANRQLGNRRPSGLAAIRMSGATMTTRSPGAISTRRTVRCATAWHNGLDA